MMYDYGVMTFVISVRFVKKQRGRRLGSTEGAKSIEGAKIEAPQAPSPSNERRRLARVEAPQGAERVG